MPWTAYRSIDNAWFMICVCFVLFLVLFLVLVIESKVMLCLKYIYLVIIFICLFIHWYLFVYRSPVIYHSYFIECASQKKQKYSVCRQYWQLMYSQENLGTLIRGLICDSKLIFRAFQGVTYMFRHPVLR